METAQMTFHKLIQDSQDFGSDDEHMVSRVFFSLEVGGKRHPNLYVNIKQTVGGSENDPLEVGHPEGYSGPFNYEAFSRVVESYGLWNPDQWWLKHPHAQQHVRAREPG